MALSSLRSSFTSLKCMRQSRSFLLCRLAFFALSLASFVTPAIALRSFSLDCIFWSITSATSALRWRKLSTSVFMKSPTYLFTVTPSGLMVCEPSFILVWLSNIGSSTLMAMAPTSPLRISVYSKFLLKNSFIVFARCSLNALWCVPPCVVCCPFTNEWYSSPYCPVCVKAISMSSPLRCTMGYSPSVVIVSLSRSLSPLRLSIRLPLYIMASPVFR